MSNKVIVQKPKGIPTSTAGRLEMAQALLQMGLIKTPEQYLQILEGDLKALQRRENCRKIKERLGVK